MSHITYADATGAAVFEESFLGDMAPFTDPVNHLLEILFHSSLDNYCLAMAPQTITVPHALVNNDGGFNLGAQANSINYFVGRASPVTHALVTHGLGFIPIVMVLDSNGFALPASFPIQQNGTVGHREVSVYVTTTQVGLWETASPGNSTLAAFNKDYTVYVFDTPAPDPSKPMCDLEAGIFGQGKFDATQGRMRRAITGETASLRIPAGRMTDIGNGVARYVQANGTIIDFNSTTILYPGSFAGSASIAAVVV